MSLMAFVLLLAASLSPEQGALRPAERISGLAGLEDVALVAPGLYAARVDTREGKKPWQTARRVRRDGPVPEPAGEMTPTRLVGRSELQE